MRGVGARPGHRSGGFFCELLVGQFKMPREILQSRVTRDAGCIGKVAIVFGSSIGLAMQCDSNRDSRWEREVPTLMFSFIAASPKVDMMIRLGKALAACMKHLRRSNKRQALSLLCKLELRSEMC